MKKLLAVIFICTSTLALAHDAKYPVGSKMHDWFMKLHNGNGSPCCADADGNVVMDADWDTKDGHYRVRLDGNWVDVPDEAVIKEPNLYGPTMVWPLHSYGYLSPSSFSIRCFLPGSGM